MDFFEVVTKRRSLRRFTEEQVLEESVYKAMEAAVKAPNSSNTQTWNFYWVQSSDKKQKLVEACLSQSAARTANQLFVVTADPTLWRRSQPGLIDWVETSQAPPMVHSYYKKLIPWMYRWGLFNSMGLLKWIATTVVGLFRPMMRGPYTKRDMQEVAIKSAALACENFVLAMVAQGYATCMMEGFDEQRVSKLLKLRRAERVVMVIAVGKEAERGTWGRQFRLSLDEVFHRV
jgi:nitroreductase